MLLDMTARPSQDQDHWRLVVVTPEAFAALRNHDLDQASPPERMSPHDYDWMRPVFRIMREAIRRNHLFRKLGLVARVQDRLWDRLGSALTEEEAIAAYRAFLLDDLMVLGERGEIV